MSKTCTTRCIVRDSVAKRIQPSDASIAGHKPYKSDGAGDPDRDGFVEYHPAVRTGALQSGLEGFPHDSVFHAGGRLAEGFIALAEVQGYVFVSLEVLRTRGRVQVSIVLTH